MYIIIIGCGRLGSTLAKELSDSGHDISILDRDGEKLQALGSGFNGQRVRGIEFDSDKLIEAGIMKADALLAVTADDNVNITVSMIAERIYHVPKIFARVNNPGKHYIFDKLNIKTINPVQMEIKLLKKRLAVENLDVMSALEDDYEIIELNVDKDRSATVDHIEQKHACIISGIVTDGKLRLPLKTDQVHLGDRMICTIQKKDKARLVNAFTRRVI